MAAALAAVSGCQRTPAPASRAAPALAPASPDLGAEAVALIPAARCGECHGKMEGEWRRSAHARADTSPLYRAMRADAGTASCDRCHAPLRALAPGDKVVAEGVTCEVCHTIASVQVGRPGGAGFLLHLEDRVRYGPLCDAQPHYFHSMGCSPLHAEAEFCAGCHDLSRELPGGGSLAVFPEYSEWRDEPPTVVGLSCQHCHMPAERAEVAVGSPARPSVRRHSFQLRGELRGRALSGRARISLIGGRLRVALSLKNSGAGHAVPTGLPAHRLRVGVEVLDGTGRVLAQVEHGYGRILVDAADNEVPFYAAVRQRADTRIRPGETRDDTFELDHAGTGGRLRVFVAWQAIAPALAAKLRVVPPPDEPMIAAVLPLPLLTRQPGEATVVELGP